MKTPTLAAVTPIALALASTLPARSGLGCRPAVKPWTPASVTAIYGKCYTAEEAEAMERQARGENES